MSSEALLLVGRRTAHSQKPFAVHAERLARRDIVDDVVTATYESEPCRELRDPLQEITADRVYVVPMYVAHTFDTLGDLPAALSHVSGAVHYCEPLGQSPAVTDVLARAGADLVPASDDVSFVLVAFGSSSKPYHRQTTEYHASRIAEQSDYGEVLPCYLLQNPAVECVRYTISNSRAVAVPLFLAPTEATEETIPAKLELERGGIEYADPPGDDVRVTDAIHAEVEKQRVLTRAGEPPAASFEAQLTQGRRALAADGDGSPR